MVHALMKKEKKGCCLQYLIPLTRCEESETGEERWPRPRPRSVKGQSGYRSPRRCARRRSTPSADKSRTRTPFTATDQHLRIAHLSDTQEECRRG